MKSLLFSVVLLCFFSLSYSQAPVSIQYLRVAHTNPRFLPCLGAQGNYDGAPVITQDCTLGSAGSKHWTIVSGVGNGTSPGPTTQIKLFGNKCLDVTNGNAQSGTKLQIWTCFSGNTNQRWQVNGDSTIKWAGKPFCLDLTDGSMENGRRPQIWSCNPNNINQHWRVIPPA